MPLIKTKVDTASEDFEQNAAVNRALVAELKELQQHILAVARNAPGKNTWRAASCCRETVSIR